MKSSMIGKTQTEHENTQYAKIPCDLINNK